MSEEKKLTDEEIIKALEFCAKDGPCLWENKCPLRNDKNCHVTLSMESLDLINRQKAEIERLKKQLKHLQADMKLEVGIRDKENAELQKQVDELKSRLWASENAVKEMSNAFGRERAIADKAVKDTAKEILQEIGNEACEHHYLNGDCDWFNRVCKKYGVEVE